MGETLRQADGVGLAAPQVGILRQVVVVINENDELIELVNPEIIQSSGEQFGLEGCLSVPGRYGFVKRPMVVRTRTEMETPLKWKIRASPPGASATRSTT